MKEYIPVREGKVREIYDIGDYLIIRATDRMQDEMDRFFRGKGAAKIHRISEPDVVIRFLRNEAAEYRKRRDKTRIARKRR